ncbi:hypothetical protein AQUCO_00201416v1 [Aquilegia coerulea]|uniref:Uncharacterized protein n=1 Tax=Aquilegia coerulea TaxID=218851 RepID=A0A2G5F7X7_AQUCA|nr:hypothetical protein AQUCO_00201416v1 [Aquilegia coerulea]
MQEDSIMCSLISCVFYAQSNSTTSISKALSTHHRKNQKVTHCLLSHHIQTHRVSKQSEITSRHTIRWYKIQ